MPDQEQDPKISIKDTKEMACECGNTVFIQAISMREISALLTGTGRTEYIPVAKVVCSKCEKTFERPSIIIPA